MNMKIGGLVALAASVTLVPVASAGPAANKQRVAISMKILPDSTFVFAPLQTGALKPDSGAITNVDSVLAGAGARTVVRSGLTVTIFPKVVWILKGKRGTLTIRERNEWVDIGNDANRDGSPDGIGLGKWTIVRGTGQYAHLSGGGGSAHEGLGQIWFARQEGFLGPK
jgi:hypothetical protein